MWLSGYGLSIIAGCPVAAYCIAAMRLTAAMGRDDLLGHLVGRLGVVLEFHRVGGAPLGKRTQRGGIAEHPGQRHLGAHQLASPAGDAFHAMTPAAPRGTASPSGARETFGGSTPE